MSQRIKAGLAAIPLLGVMWALVVFVPLPYVTYSPGPSVNVLADREGSPIVQVDGHEVFRDDGELRLTTIYVDDPEQKITLLRVMEAWLDDDDAVYPRSAVYQPDATNEQDSEESAQQMVSSQDAAVAAALTELGIDYTPLVEVQNVEKGMPADGKLKVGDVLISIDGTAIFDAESVVEKIRGAGAGNPLDWVVRRGAVERTETITAVEDEGVARVGVTPAPSFEFPFDVTIDLGDNIGGPSAGMMFALAIYDTLTPGSLTGGNVIAGTGEIRDDGTVVPIGGAQQKIAGARDGDVELFLLPAKNCASLDGVDPGDMRVASVATLSEALEALITWVDDPSAELPTCESGT